MKNSESFNGQLDLLGSGNPEAAELAALQKELQSHASGQERSDQHQTWAWTRLRAELRHPAPSPFAAWKRYLLPALTGAAALLLLGTYLTGSRPNLLIEAVGDNLYGSTFISNNAEVIWVTGYDYIPSSYPLK